MKGLFDLTSADDLCSKLEHDAVRVRDNPANAFAAFDFVVTAWHLLEWRYPGNIGRATRDALCVRFPILLVCEHLAVGVKHFEAQNPKLGSVATTRRESVWGKDVWDPRVWSPGFWKDDLVVQLDGVAQSTIGDRITVLHLVDLALAFWRVEGGCPKA